MNVRGKQNLKAKHVFEDLFQYFISIVNLNRDVDEHEHV